MLRLERLRTDIVVLELLQRHRGNGPGLPGDAGKILIVDHHDLAIASHLNIKLDVGNACAGSGIEGRKGVFRIVAAGAAMSK